MTPDHTTAVEAMLSDRPHRSALDFDLTRRSLHDLSGKQFDPAMVEAVVAALPEWTSMEEWRAPRHDGPRDR